MAHRRKRRVTWLSENHPQTATGYFHCQALFAAADQLDVVVWQFDRK
jgi:hypothetical protein